MVLSTLTGGGTSADSKVKRGSKREIRREVRALLPLNCAKVSAPYQATVS